MVTATTKEETHTHAVWCIRHLTHGDSNDERRLGDLAIMIKHAADISDNLSKQEDDDRIDRR